MKNVLLALTLAFSVSSFGADPAPRVGEQPVNPRCECKTCSHDGLKCPNNDDNRNLGKPVIAPIPNQPARGTQQKQG